MMRQINTLMIPYAERNFWDFAYHESRHCMETNQTCCSFFTSIFHFFGKNCYFPII